MKLFFLFIVAATAACDSPRNHRVDPSNDGNSSSLTLQSFKASNLQVKAEWLAGPFPDVKKPSTLIVYLYNSKGTLESLPPGQELNFYATMVSMGHALDQPGYFEEISTGIYLNNGISFNMSGDWTMELWQQDADFNILEKVTWPDFLQP